MIKTILVSLIVISGSIYAQNRFEIINLKYNHSNPGSSREFASENYKEFEANINYGIELTDGLAGFAGLNYLKLNYSGINFSSNTGIVGGLIHYSKKSKHTLALGMESSNGKSLFSKEFFKYSFFYNYEKRLGERLTLKGGVFYKKELFDNILFPLIGGKINFNESLSLDILLPMKMKLEQKLSNFIRIGFLSEWDIYSVTHESGYLKNETIAMLGYVDLELVQGLILKTRFGKNLYSDSYIYHRETKNKNTISRDKGFNLELGLAYAINSRKD